MELEWNEMSDEDLEAHKKAALDLSAEAKRKKEEHLEKEWEKIVDEIQAVITERKNIRDLYG